MARLTFLLIFINLMIAPMVALMVILTESPMADLMGLPLLMGTKLPCWHTLLLNPNLILPPPLLWFRRVMAMD